MKTLYAYGKLVSNGNKEGYMSKVASYLRGHIAGEVSTRADVRTALSRDAGVLEQKPEMVVYPRSVNDIRKVVRFAWQLAEKGHVLPLTVRGAGTDATGAAIGKGALIVTSVHLNTIFEYDARQKLVRLQPGVSVNALNNALGLHGTAVMPLVGSRPQGTIGGAIASATAGRLAGKYGTIGESIEQLEVVLANGDVLQTGRVSKKELNRKKGLQGLEGDIYRGVDAILEEYADILDTLRENDATGYNTIADVKQKDGSFDLAPLFIGSQGTLGIISEMIMKAEFRGTHYGVAMLVFATDTAARDALDDLSAMKPAFLEYFDADLFNAAAKQGRTYAFYDAALKKFTPTAVVMVGFDDFSEKARAKALKKVAKKFGDQQGVSLASEDADMTSDALAALDASLYTTTPDTGADAASDLYAGFFVPTARLEDFVGGLRELSAHERIALPLAGHVLTGTYSVYPTFDLKKVADKQKIIKLLDELAKLVYAHGGTMLAEGGEGRIKTRAIHAQIDDRLIAMYAAIRKVCDPLGTLNPGVKEPVDIRTLATMLRSEHDREQNATFGL